jgi:cytochrome oxidase Cu insertion factor (SCO1/SenC/PrrC family)
MRRATAITFFVLALAGTSLGCTRFEPDPQALPGERAPNFELVDQHGGRSELAALLAGGQPVVLVFYRGHW